ncbi:preprotein translocase subunit SecE [Corynebacterium sp. 13CS0277]|uniref:preprotein translocase subunit SecE n=1 Tax=Corynebacterium sp. 13CS0277 TaxID=2071994 RepID=UPI000D035153|nr:preprotein translocase subunit SecE [Corynebacterium sp. 13CS0277]PRQ10650.1 preprotein translocase subunit SecE [Corynebacterium sp. 13CS0277]
MADEKQPEKVGAARPAGKRQVTGVATTAEAYEAKKKVAKPAEDSTPGGSVATFLPEVASEMKKVIWPTPKQMVVYTTIVLAFLIAVTALVAGVDFLAGLGVEKILIRD